MKPKRPKYYSPPAVRQRAKELRRRMTPAELRLWDRLRKKQLLGLKFRPQHPVHHFILDFYCYSQHLVIELDGSIHDQQQDYDQARAEWLTQRDFKVIRFSNEAIFNDIEGVLQKISQACTIQPADAFEDDEEEE